AGAKGNIPTNTNPTIKQRSNTSEVRAGQAASEASRTHGRISQLPPLADNRRARSAAPYLRRGRGRARRSARAAALLDVDALLATGTSKMRPHPRLSRLDEPFPLRFPRGHARPAFGSSR